MKYRREIDGLRAIAVVSVILFYAGYDLLSGGYLGVDIFFVLSGYLITSIILKDLAQGRFSIIKFYEKRCRRILPALFLVLLVCVPLAYLWLLPNELKAFARSLTYTSISVSNIYFFNSTNYFDRASELKPLLHTWSLGVEEQFYFIFPALMLFLWKKGLKTTYLVLAGIAFLSLVISHWAAIHYPLANFYLLPTRAWELLAGSLVGIYLFNQSSELRPTKWTSTLSGLGLALLAYSIFSFEEGTPNPSFYTLIPIIGTLLIIVFTHPQQLVGKILSSRWRVGIGLVSYSAYLWHQPLFAFLRIKSLGTLDIWTISAATITTFLLAFLSWKFVETPARDLNKMNRRQVFIGAGIGIVLFLSLGITGEAKKGFENRFSIPTEVINDFNLDSFAGECYAHHFCEVGDLTDKKSDVLVLGDSHAQSILSAFDLIGHKTHQKISFMGMVGCPPLHETIILKGPPILDVCDKLVIKQIEFVKEHKPKKIFLVARWSIYVDGEYDGRGLFYLGKTKTDPIEKQHSSKTFKDGLEKTIANYQALGAEVYIVAQVPQQRFSAKEFYYLIFDKKTADDQKLPLLRKYSVSQEEHARLQKNNRDLFTAYQTRGLGQFINLDPFFCNEHYCSLGSTDRSYYRDKDHLSNFGAEQLAPLLLPYVQK